MTVIDLKINLYYRNYLEFVRAAGHSRALTVDDDREQALDQYPLRVSVTDKPEQQRASSVERQQTLRY